MSRCMGDVIKSESGWTRHDVHTEDCDDAEYMINKFTDERIKGRIYDNAPKTKWFLPLPRFGGWFELGATFITSKKSWERYYDEDFTSWNRNYPNGFEDYYKEKGSHVADRDFNVKVYKNMGKTSLPVYQGEYEAMYASYLYMRNTPPEVSEEIVERLWMLSRSDEDTFSGLPWCGCCGKALTDDVSRTLGIGPECASKIGLPHTKTIAGRVTLARELRSQTQA